MRLRWLVFYLLAVPSAYGGALTKYQDLSSQMRTTVQNNGWFAKGIGENNWYAIEVDPATGTLPFSVTISNPSVSTTGTAVPASATMVGGSDGTNLKALKVSTTGVLSVDGSAVTQPVSGTFWQATQPVSGTVAATQSGTWTNTVTQATGSNLHVVVDTAPTTAVTGTFWQATQPVSGTVTANAGTGTMTTDQTTSAATFQDGSIAFGSLTTSYATVITTGGVVKHLDMRNNTNAVIVVSLNAGSTTSYTLDAGDSVSLDLKSIGLSIASSTALQAKYSGSAPTSGSIRINAAY